MINPETDGIDHINIYSKGRTELGRLLSNFAYTPFYHPLFGKFDSIEGFWYWLLVPEGVEGKEALRKESGWRAKKLGRELGATDWGKSQQFKQYILQALEIKYQNVPKLRELLAENTLPFKHYYVYYGKIIEPKEGKWILDFWTEKWIKNIHI